MTAPSPQAEDGANNVMATGGEPASAWLRRHRTLACMTPQTDPEFLPFKLDLVARRVLLVRLTAQQRRDAAFLDERALPPGVDGGWLPLDALPLDAWQAHGDVAPAGYRQKEARALLRALGTDAGGDDVLGNAP